MLNKYIPLNLAIWSQIISLGLVVVVWTVVLYFMEQSNERKLQSVEYHTYMISCMRTATQAECAGRAMLYVRIGHKDYMLDLRGN